MLLPSLSKAKAKGQGAHCINNLRQLDLGWLMYATDNRDVLPGDDWKKEATPVQDAGNWVSGWLSPDGETGYDKTHNTNITYLLDPHYSQIGPYVRAAGVYKCVADQSITTIMGRAYARVRSMSMNCWMGANAEPWNAGFRTFAKSTSITLPGPSDAMVFIDERSDSIDDGYFAVDEVAQQLVNLPAGYHNGASGITFADGHAEIHKWHDGRTTPPLLTVFHKFVQCPGNRDLAWLQQHATSRQ